MALYKEYEKFPKAKPVKPQNNGVRRHIMPLFDVDLANIPLKFTSTKPPIDTYTDEFKPKDCCATSIDDEKENCQREANMASNKSEVIELSGLELKSALDSYLKSALKDQLSQLCNQFQTVFSQALQ